ncbi:FAD-binding oxidoreductase [Chlamydiales bacterium]|nr:FAD-binding oxidoreductase [Chlamydiales bacterium]
MINRTSNNPYDIKADKVITQLDHEYENARLDQYAGKAGNKKYTSTKFSPSIIIYCSTEEQIVNAVNFAKDHDYKVTCRSGGGSYTGESSSALPRSMQIDISAMDQIGKPNNNIIVAEAGATIRKLIKTLLFNRLSFPHGLCKDVGLGGHLQSSGMGLLSSSHGSGLEYVLSFRIVLADGTIKVFSQNDKDPKFYKGILGGAPGSWGVITQFTLKCIPDSECPHSRLIIKKYPYNKDLMVKVINTVNSILLDQDEKNLRDLSIAVSIGCFLHKIDLLPDLPIIGGLDKWFDVNTNKKKLYKRVLFMERY